MPADPSQIVDFYDWFPSITIPDGTGGWQNYALSNMAVAYTSPHLLTNLQSQSALLGYLNVIWGALVAAGQGVPDDPATGAGVTSIGTV